MDRTIEAVFFGRHEADPRALLYFEWRQRLESGYEVGRFESGVRSLATAEPGDTGACWALLEEIEAAPRDPEWGFDESGPVPAGRSGVELRTGRGNVFASESGDSAAPRDPECGYDEGEPVDGGTRGAESQTGRGDAPQVVASESDDSARPHRAAGSAVPSTPDELLDRIYGGWLGRCVGCTLGKPLENGFVWTREHIRAYLEQAGAYPLTDYVPAVLPPPFPLNPTWPVSVRGRIDGAPRDDDIDYTVLGLHLLESRGLNFTTDDVATLWLERLPFLQTYTAERVAYRNLVDGLHPPATATFRNPYREWIGAMIRADIFGYVNPGNPHRAAALAAREAAVSHTGNGIYAAMWAAALIAAAFTAGTPPTPPTDAPSLVQAAAPEHTARVHAPGLAMESSAAATTSAEPSAVPSADSPARGFAAGGPAVPATLSAPAIALMAAQSVIPPRSRLAVALAEVYDDYDRRLSWEEAVDNIDARHGAYNWVHAIPNACRVAAGLLWGAGDFTRTVALTVQSGADTDSNGATAGSVAGILLGAKGIPAQWTDPLHDTLHSAVIGYDGACIADLARRTWALV
ncbi:ADP-ribosylglycohydrolase family protein [Nocardia lijiangensis]|uniref:ADP-ribosylglycohydrolase family protein n=1 Tax=Nocardia lijiangensis TaxID=299618 RepID=UPI003D741767